MLVTDAEYKHTLGAVRSLGRKGRYLVAGSSSRRAQSFYSRYCGRSFVYPNPTHDVEFSRFLSDYAQENTIDVLLPIGYMATNALFRHKEEFPPRVKLSVAGCKDKTMAFVTKLGVPTPKTYESPGQVERFPVDIKSVEGFGNLRYVNSPGELPQADCPGSVI